MSKTLLCVLPCEDNGRGDQVFARWLNGVLRGEGYHVEVIGPAVSEWQKPLLSWLVVGELAQFSKVSLSAERAMAGADGAIVHVPAGICSGPGLSIFHNNISEYALNRYSRCHPARWRLNLINKNMERVSGRGRKINVAISKSQANYLTRSGIRIDEVIYHPIDLARFRPLEDKSALRETLGLPHDRVIAIAAGANDRRKNWPAVLSLTARFPEVLFLVLGASNLLPSPAPLNCRLIGSVPHAEIHRYYQASDIFVTLSFMEACSFTLLESLACGLAVVSTPVGMVPDLAGYDKIFTEATVSFEPSNIYDGFARMVEGAGLRREMGAAGRRFAEVHLHEGSRREKYLALIHSALPSAPK